VYFDLRDNNMCPFKVSIIKYCLSFKFLTIILFNYNVKILLFTFHVDFSCALIVTVLLMNIPISA
jgi:hypothetical protein